MNYSKEVQDEITVLSNNGCSSRDIASCLGISKSGVNQFLNRSTEALHSNGGPKVLFFDLETAPDISATFGRWNVNIATANILQEGDWLLSASWSWLGQDTVHSAVITPQAAKRADDSAVVKKMLEVYDKADIVVAHNGKSFDVPILRTRTLLNNLTPPRNVRIIDTLQMAKKLKFRSNKLDSLAQRLGLGEKVKHSGISLWIDCLRGDPVALQKMKEYNVVDVQLLKEAYYELAPFDNSTPNFATYFNDDVERCRSCGSTNLVHTGKKSYSNLGKFSEVVCSHCGTHQRQRTNELTKQKRKNLLA